MRLAILFVAVLLQTAAAVMAVRMIRITGHLAAWILLSVMLALMAARRILAFAKAEWGLTGADPWNEGLGLLVSALAFLAIWRIQEHFTSSRAQAERLQESEATARALVENAADAVEILDLQGRFLEVNAAACESLGYTKAELIGGTPALLDTRMDAAAISSAIATISARGELVFETTHRRKSGEEFPVEIHSRLVTYGGQPAIMSIVRDITERRRLEEVHRNARKAEGLVQMAGGVAHDFNNLFQVVLANLELARTHAAPESRAVAHIDRARTALERASGLAQRIQQFSGGILQVLEPTCLSRLAAELRDEVDAWKDGQWNLAEDLPPVSLDAVQVRHAAEALLSNAWEAGGPVRIRTYARRVEVGDLAVGTWAGNPCEGTCVVFDVEDHGPGIAAEDMMQLFDPFFSTKGLGRGLGLAAALGIVRSHGGAIQVVSARGLGSAVRLHFPLPAEAATAPAAP